MTSTIPKQPCQYRRGKEMDSTDPKNQSARRELLHRFETRNTTNLQMRKVLGRYPKLAVVRFRKLRSR